MCFLRFVHFRVDVDFYHLLTRRGVEGDGEGVAVARAETERGFQKVGYAAHRKLNQRGALLDVLRNQKQV